MAGGSVDAGQLPGRGAAKRDAVPRYSKRRGFRERKPIGLRFVAPEMRCLRFEIDEILELDAKAVRYADEGVEPGIARSLFDLAESRSIHAEHGGELLLGKPRGFSQAHYLLAHVSFCS